MSQQWVLYSASLSLDNIRVTIRSNANTNGTGNCNNSGTVVVGVVVSGG
jgi:hypothetical protein